MKVQRENEVETLGYQHIERRRRQEKVLTRKQEQSVIDFCHSNESSSIDSNSKRVLELKRRGIIEKHVGRMWAVSTYVRHRGAQGILPCALTWTAPCA